MKEGSTKLKLFSDNKVVNIIRIYLITLIIELYIMLYLSLFVGFEVFVFFFRYYPRRKMLVSIGIILTILFACDRLRNYIIFKTNRAKLVHNLILDVIVTIELCTVSLELGVVFKHYGFWCWFVGL